MVNSVVHGKQGVFFSGNYQDSFRDIGDRLIVFVIRTGDIAHGTKTWPAFIDAS
jgi:hypothetical protein